MDVKHLDAIGKVVIFVKEKKTRRISLVIQIHSQESPTGATR